MVSIRGREQDLYREEPAMQHSASIPRQNAIADLARDFSISTRALAFCVGIQGLVLGSTRKVHALSRREIEAVTTMDHKAWPLAEAEGLGVVQVSSGSPRLDEAGTWSVGCVISPPQSTTQEINTSTEVTTTEEGSTTAWLCGGVVTPPPADDRWTSAMDTYALDTWRLALAMGMDTAPVGWRDLGWMKQRAAQRFLARARERGLVIDGVWQGWMLRDGAMFTSGMGRANERQAKARVERAQYQERVSKISAAVRSFSANLDSMEHVPDSLVCFVGHQDLIRGLYEPEVAEEPVIAGW